MTDGRTVPTLIDTMALPSKWQPLPNFPQLPALLVSASFAESSYTLYITDLANIWVEHLDRRGILSRSLQERTSIDLYEAGTEQWAVFLSKLRAAFDPTSSDHRLTSLGIASGSDPKNPDHLTLRIVCDLPGDLPALEWPVHLVKCQTASLTTKLVLPLIQEHHVQHREAKDLVVRLKEKDALIKKLLDKLSTMHTPLESIFNSLSSKHAVTRAAAEERIKGLAPFNQESWRSHLNIESPRDASSLLQSVFGEPGISCIPASDLSVPNTLDNWWTRLGPEFRSSSKLISNSASHHEPEEQVNGHDSSSETAEDQNFEVQVPLHSSPQSSNRGKLGGNKETLAASRDNDSDSSGNSPAQSRNESRPKVAGTLGRLKKAPTEQFTSQSSRTLHAADDDDDDDDTVSGSDDERQSESSKPTKTTATRLGAIGKSKGTPQEVEATTKKEPEDESNDETASGSDSDNDGVLSPRKSQRTAPATPRKGAVGRIGGKPRNVARSSQSPKGSQGPIDDSTVPKKSEARKIGAIGNKSHTEAKRAHADVTVEPEELETDEQKAERKRTELAKELSQKNAIPARKKRKF
ncbi:XLF-domain-containing protein [Astrocystis sublimbata]|nr:XLF-domain-containing protein [Astrocystis sublimbata]KAI0200966.1 XLF-domain-containing protein [Astrocystis sublimbata]